MRRDAIEAEGLGREAYQRDDRRALMRVYARLDRAD